MRIFESREKILESVNHLSSENQLYRELLKEKISQIETKNGVLHSIQKFALQQPVISTERSEWRTPVLSKQLLFEWIRTFGFSFFQCESIFTALDGEPGKEFYSFEYQLVVEKESVDIFPKGINAINPFNALKVSQFEKVDNFKIKKSSPNIAQLDYDKLKLPLKTRFWQQGDRFHPLGMHGTKLVSDFFNDLNFTAFQKKTTPILVDSNDEIVWIVGYRIDDRFKITEKTKTIYQINFDI